MEIETESGTYLAGVREQVYGTVEDTVSAIMSIIDDISAIDTASTSTTHKSMQFLCLYML